MGLLEVIAMVVVAVVIAAGVSAFVVSLAVRWVHRGNGKHGKHGKPSLGL